jgi:glutamyl-Q tRNA(Asp) synthetase
LHLGSLTAALGSWLMARFHGGRWLLRIEDIDPPREVPGMAQEQLETLAGFGLASDELVLWQSRRSEFYAHALQNLIDKNLAFECRCSRSDLATTNGIHHACVADPSGATPATRLRVAPGTIGFDDAIRGRFEQDMQAEVGDVVLKRADGFWAYQLAVVVDDEAQGITQVVRGADLIDSTPRQIALQQALGFGTPGYAHLPLIRSADGGKLSKALASTPIDRSDPLPALRLAYAWLGQDPRELAGKPDAERALQAALQAFRPDRIPVQDQVLRPD